MSIWNSLKTFFAAPPAQEGLPEVDAERFLYVLIPEPLQPVERGEKYEDPLQCALEGASLGEITGGGSSLSELHADGTRSIESCGIDVEMTDPPATLALMRAQLENLGAPIRTELHYTVRGTKLQDVYTGQGWRVGEARSTVHPGFGV